MESRIVLLITVAIAAFLAVEATSGNHYGNIYNNHYYNENKKNISHNLIIGKPGYGDKLLYNQTIHVSSHWLRKVSYNFSYPTGYPQYYYLSSIQFWDLKTDGTGAYAKLTGGGLGYRNCSAYLESQRSHGIHFQVILYGHY